METTYNQTSTVNYKTSVSKKGSFSKLILWCDGQETYRFGWLGAIIAFHGCVLTPITLFAVILSGSNIWLFSAAIVAMGMSLVTNLAAMPTKITIPVFFLSIIIDIVIISMCIVSGFSLAAAFL